MSAHIISDEAFVDLRDAMRAMGCLQSREFVLSDGTHQLDIGGERRVQRGASRAPAPAIERFVASVLAIVIIRPAHYGLVVKEAEDAGLLEDRGHDGLGGTSYGYTEAALVLKKRADRILTIEKIEKLRAELAAAEASLDAAIAMDAAMDALRRPKEEANRG